MNEKELKRANATFASCPLTAECLHMFDELPVFQDSALAPSGLLSKREERRVKQLAQHVQSCRSCATAIEEEQQTRYTQQRQLLHTMLGQAEIQVPSTRSSIMAALREEQEHPVRRHSRSEVQPLGQTFLLPLDRSQAQKGASHFSTKLRTIFIAAVAAVIILASANIFAHQIGVHSALKSVPQAASRAIHVSLIPSSAWSSVLVSEHVTPNSDSRLENYDASNGQHAQLFPACCSSVASFNALAHNGQDGVYQHFDGHKTAYHLLSGHTYTIDGRGSNAIWDTFDNHIFLESVQGLIGIDRVGGVQQVLPITLHVEALLFYYAGFLYFTRASDQALYRVEIATGRENMVVQNASSRLFWLDPTGTTIYYQHNTAGYREIYAVASDGSSVQTPHLLYSDGTLIGYASDYSLMVVRQEQDSSFHLVKIAPTFQAEEVLALNTLLTGITSLCDGALPADGIAVCDRSLALAPGGTRLIAATGYADGSHKLWSIDLVTRISQQLLTYGSQVHLQLIGWTKFAVQ